MTAKAWVASGACVAGAALSLFWLLRPSIPPRGPEPIRYEREACVRCHMRFGAMGFAGERRDSRGQLTKYDDIGCLLLAMWEAHEESPEVWVEDHLSSAFVPLLGAALVLDSDLPTPMGYGIIAFRETEAASEFIRAHGGRLTSVEELLHERSRWKRASAQR